LVARQRRQLRRQDDFTGVGDPPRLEDRPRRRSAELHTALSRRRNWHGGSSLPRVRGGFRHEAHRFLGRGGGAQDSRLAGRHFGEPDSRRRHTRRNLYDPGGEQTFLRHVLLPARVFAGA
jgi:hypothetical protein